MENGERELLKIIRIPTWNFKTENSIYIEIIHRE